MLNDLNFQFYIFKIPMKSRVAVSLGEGGGVFPNLNGSSLHIALHNHCSIS